MRGTVIAFLTDYRGNRPLNPVHAILLGFPVSMFTGAFLIDLASWSTSRARWADLASWLIIGGLVPGVLVLLWVLVGLIRAGSRRLVRSVLYFAILLAMCGLGCVNALMHAADAMPAGLILSAIVWALAAAAAWVGYSGVPPEDARSVTQLSPSAHSVRRPMRSARWRSSGSSS